jgi:hypothetical protein
MFLSVAFFALALALFGAMFAGFLRFDRMLRHIYESDHLRWERIGRPRGYFWQPRETVPFFGSCFARDELFFRFLCSGFKEPKD